MNYNKLSENNIFVIPIGDEWNVAPERVTIVYAPKNGHISLASKASADNLERCVEGDVTDEDISAALARFQAKGTVPVHYLPQSPDDLYQIDILSNYTCNFRCIYCYSAAGRSSKQIEWDKIKAVIDYLFCSGKKQKNPYIINFSGGGEPLLSFPLIKRSVEYIKQVNKGKDYIYNVGLVTNGSLITPEIIDFLQAENIDMAVSFEILQSLQDKERGSYDRVASNIDMMLARNYPFGIRTTFTPESVTRMSEMIEQMAVRFPKLKKVVFDTVLAPSLFPTAEDLRRYYDTFIEEYYKAKKLAASKGIKVESIAVETLSMVRDRTCQGKIVLTPMGTISSCARISSPLESLYEGYLYGQIEDNKLKLNDERFSKIMALHNIYTQPECEHCFAKWNCGGGCRLFRDSFSEEFNSVRCDFARKALRRQLFEVLAGQYENATGKNLHAMVKEKIENNEI